eukprot:8271303-Karenia_brevis.AAC.1
MRAVYVEVLLMEADLIINELAKVEKWATDDDVYASACDPATTLEQSWTTTWYEMFLFAHNMDTKHASVLQITKSEDEWALQEKQLQAKAMEKSADELVAELQQLGAKQEDIDAFKELSFADKVTHIVSAQMIKARDAETLRHGEFQDSCAAFMTRMADVQTESAKEEFLCESLFDYQALDNVMDETTASLSCVTPGSYIKLAE